MGLLGSSPIPPSFVACCVSFQLRPLPSTGITRFPRYYWPLRHPRRPSLALTSCRLIVRSPLGLPVLRLVPFVCMPSLIPRQDRWDCSLVLSHRRRPSLDSRRVSSCITRFGACTAFTFVTAYKLAKSPTRPSTPEASAASLPPLLLRLLPGGANQFPGGTFTHCGSTQQGY